MVFKHPLGPRHLQQVAQCCLDLGNLSELVSSGAVLKLEHCYVVCRELFPFGVGADSRASLPLCHLCCHRGNQAPSQVTGITGSIWEREFVGRAELEPDSVFPLLTWVLIASAGGVTGNPDAEIPASRWGSKRMSKGTEAGWRRSAVPCYSCWLTVTGLWTVICQREASHKTKWNKKAAR